MAAASFPDTEAITCRRLAGLVGGLTHVGLATPSDLQSRMPFVRVTRYGGSDDDVTDRAAIDVDVYAPTRSVARRVAEQVRDLLTAHPWRDVAPDGAASVIDGVDTITGPFQPPAGLDSQVDDPSVRQVVRYTAAYSVRARRTRAV